MNDTYAAALDDQEFNRANRIRSSLPRSHSPSANRRCPTTSPAVIPTLTRSPNDSVPATGVVTTGLPSASYPYILTVSAALASPPGGHGTRPPDHLWHSRSSVEAAGSGR